MVASNKNLYLAAYDGSAEEAKDFRCMRLEFDTAEKSYILHYM